MDEKYTIPDNPQYDADIRKLQNVDPASATATFNPLFEQLIENTAALKAQSDELEEKVEQAGNKEELEAHIEDTDNPHQVTKAQVGLGNADNTSDAEKPVSTAVREALDSISDDVSAAGSTASDAYAQANAAYSQANTAYSRANAAYDLAVEAGSKEDLNAHIANTSNPHQVTKAQVGLGAVDNTSDADKPISTAVQTAISAVNANVSAANTTAVNAYGQANAAASAAANAQMTANSAYTQANNAFGQANTANIQAGAAYSRANDAYNLASNGSFDMNPIKIGQQAVASATNSIAIGTGANSRVANTISMGTNASANATGAVALGSNSTANDAYTIAIGFNATSYNTSGTGGNNIAIGANASADSNSTQPSIALGSNAKVNGGWGGLAIGTNAFVNGNRGVGIGYNAVTSAGASIALGSFANAGDETSSIAIGSNATLSGSYDHVNSMAIGTNARIAANTGNCYQSTAFGFNAVVTGSNYQTIQLGASNLRYLRCATSLTTSSDQNDKTDIREISDALSFVEKLKPVTYVRNNRLDYIDDDMRELADEEIFSYGITQHYNKAAHAQGMKKADKLLAGLLAQEVGKAYAEVYGEEALVNSHLVDYTGGLLHNCVSEKTEAREKAITQRLRAKSSDVTSMESDSKDKVVETLMALSYEELIPYLIGAVKELSDELKQLKKSL